MAQSGEGYWARLARVARERAPISSPQQWPGGARPLPPARGDLKAPVGTPARWHFATPSAWTALASSNVVAAAFFDGGPHGEPSVLGVRFGENGITEREYWYFPAAKADYDALVSAASKGRHVWTEIRLSRHDGQKFDVVVKVRG